MLFHHKEPHHTIYTLQRYSTFLELQFEGPLLILKVSPQALVVNVLVVLIKLQTKQVFFSDGSHLPISLVLGRAALTRWCLRLLSWRNLATGTLGNAFL